MLINIFGKWIKADLIKGFKSGDCYPLRAAEGSEYLYKGTSIILSTSSYYMSPSYKEDTECRYNDYIWFPDKTEDDLAEEINRQIKANRLAPKEIR